MKYNPTEIVKKLKEVLNISLADDTPPAAPAQAPAPQQMQPVGVSKEELDKYALKEELNTAIATFTAMIEQMKGLMGKTGDVPATLAAEPVIPAVTTPAVVATPATAAPVIPAQPAAVAPATPATAAPVATPAPVAAVAAPVAQIPAIIANPEPDVVHSPTSVVDDKPLMNILPDKPKSEMDRVMKALWG